MVMSFLAALPGIRKPFQQWKTPWNAEFRITSVVFRRIAFFAATSPPPSATLPVLRGVATASLVLIRSLQHPIVPSEKATPSSAVRKSTRDYEQIDAPRMAFPLPQARPRLLNDYVRVGQVGFKERLFDLPGLPDYDDDSTS
jgi:hypothetical protein